eukprot:jgi/Hompol1/4748/HPOL_003843-RA
MHGPEYLTAESLSQGLVSHLIMSMGRHIDIGSSQQKLDVGRSFVNGFLDPKVFATTIDLLQHMRYMDEKSVQPPTGSMSTAATATTPTAAASASPQPNQPRLGHEQRHPLFTEARLDTLYWLYGVTHGVSDRTIETIVGALASAASSLHEMQLGACVSCWPRILDALKTGTSPAPNGLRTTPYFTVAFRSQLVDSLAIMENGGDIHANLINAFAVLPCEHYHVKH